MVPDTGDDREACRADFVNRGPVVWGARTLDGNSLDYRYIQVRRTLIYIETSVRTALNQFVFAPNDGQTWVAVTAMVSGFLTNLWSQGGLMGDKASDLRVTFPVVARVDHPAAMSHDVAGFPQET